MTPSEFLARHFSQIIFDLFPDSFYFKVLMKAAKPRAHCGTSPAPSPSPSVRNRPRCKREQSRVRKFFSGNPYSVAPPQNQKSYRHLSTVHACSQDWCVHYSAKRGILVLGSHLGGWKWFFLSFKHYRNNTVHWLMGSKRNKDHLRRMQWQAAPGAERSCAAQN